ncbi:MAG: ATP-binding protein [Candidatus Velthaea sp.]
MVWSLKADREGFLFSIADAALAHNARRIFGRYLTAQADPESDVYAAELIFGELVANVARHAPGPIRVRLRWNGYDGATLIVEDSGAGYAFDARLPDALAEDHRGLYIVAKLADTVAVQRTSDGCMTSVGLPARRRRARGSSAPRA